MNCSEFKECVCEIVDHRLSEERTNELMKHAQTCPHCSYEFRSMQTTKEIVRSKLPRNSVPSDVYYAIINATLNSSNSSWFQRLFGFRLNPAVTFVGLAVIAVGIYSLFLPPKTGMPEDANIISQSMKNYQAVIGGVIKPQLVSSEDGVRTFLTNGVPFDVNVPKMKDCSSCAAVLSEFNGVKLAHVVYQVSGKDIIYIYQASMNDAMDGKTIGLPEEARDELKRTDWYVREMSDSTTLVMWRYKNTLCSAVSGMKKEQMIALLTEKDLTE